MATAIQMPKLGHTMSEGKVIHWHKQPGEPVREGEAILTIETDKTEVEVESPVAGVMGPHAARSRRPVPGGWPPSTGSTWGTSPVTAPPAQ
jgi:pyruvate carboxylase